MQGYKLNVDYDEKRGEINYLSSKGIDRPESLPKQQLVVLGVIVLIAASVAMGVLYHYVSSYVSEAEATEEAINTNLSRDVSYDIPVLTAIVELDNDGILQLFTAYGYNIYDESADEESTETSTDETTDDEEEDLELVKFASDLDLDEAVALYDEGIGNLDAVDASLLLTGMWTLEIDRSDGVNMVIHYVDFSSGDLEEAVQTALEIEGFDADTASEIDEDSSGNTYRYGTIEVNGSSYTWRISVIELSEVYDISGLPDDAIYVGIRIYD